MSLWSPLAQKLN